MSCHVMSCSAISMLKLVSRSLLKLLPVVWIRKAQSVWAKMVHLCSNVSAGHSICSVLQQRFMSHQSRDTCAHALLVVGLAVPYQGRTSASCTWAHPRDNVVCSYSICMLHEVIMPKKCLLVVWTVSVYCVRCPW